MKQLISILTLAFIFSCSHNRVTPLDKALNYAESNRSELEIVLEHYKNDSLKLKAAQYLIENMPYHHFQEEYFLSPGGDKKHLDITAFTGENEVKLYCDSLVKCGYQIKSHQQFDIMSLSSDFLIKNIELAFTAWEKPWAKDISFIDFCRYILPYRAQSESPSLLREEIMKRFMPILDSAMVTTPLEACILLNEHLKGIIKYKKTGSPFYPTIEETYYSGISQCEGICNLGIFIMRAVGIPVTVDQTTWTKMDLGHYWCVVLDNGLFYSFGPGEDHPEEHARKFSSTNIPAKVYRLRFDPIVAEINGINDGYSTYLKSLLLYDVTEEYPNKVMDMIISVDKIDGVQPTTNMVYLCVYNHYQWKPIAIGEKNDTVCVFKNVVGNNIFMVADAPDGMKLRNITSPFYVNKEGVIRKLTPQFEQQQTFTMQKRKNKLEQQHTLRYWDATEKRFLPLNFAGSTDTTQSYNNIPKNALLWFTIPEKIYNQRVFIIENDSIISF